MNKPRIGAHVSVAGGLYNAFGNAEKIGAECVQIFGGSPRTWRAVSKNEEEVKKYFDAQSLSPVKNVYLHASYMVNLGSETQLYREKSVLSLVDHLTIAEQIKAMGVIFHLGSISGQQAVDFTVAGIKEVLKQVPGNTWLIMENSAGGGKTEFPWIGEIIKRAGNDRVKVCLDTAHIFEAGGIEEYTKPKVKKLFDEFEEHIGLANLVALHVNDSKTPYNSRHDRHENIGEGHIGLDGFKNLAAEKRLQDKDWLLEVPGFDNQGPDRENVDILKGCFK